MDGWPAVVVCCSTAEIMPCMRKNVNHAKITIINFHYYYSSEADYNDDDDEDHGGNDNNSSRSQQKLPK